MKQIIALILILAAGSPLALAQRGPLRGSGKLVTKKFDYRDFDKVQLQDLAGNITITSGTQFSVEASIDDNLESLLRVKNENGKLLVYLEGNRNNVLYIEDTHIDIRISMPDISLLENRGNTPVKVNGLTGRYFRLENNGNAGVTLDGSIDELEIKNSGNGDVNAGRLTARQANVSARGNGDVLVNAAEKIEARATGNTTIINAGKAVYSETSSSSGNARLATRRQ